MPSQTWHLVILTLYCTVAFAAHLNVTALTSRGDESILQCWSLDAPFLPIDNGLTGASVINLGPLSGNATFIIQAPASIGGYKNAPRPQWSWFISGLGHITLPTSADEVFIVGGKYGLVFADDINTYGHSTTFPSSEHTVLVTFPTADGQQPSHRVVHEGPCVWEDMVGL